MIPDIDSPGSGRSSPEREPHRTAACSASAKPSPSCSRRRAHESPSPTSPVERADATLRMIDEVGGEGVGTVGDLTQLDDNQRCVAEAAEAFGGLDIVVNSAALPGGGRSPVDVGLDVWDAVMAVNLHAAFLTARHAIPHLQAAGGGSIVNIGSVAAALGHGSGAYAASKAALGALTRDWAFVHGRENIRVNCLVVGHLYTPMGSRSGPRCANGGVAAGCCRPKGWRGTSPGPRCSSRPTRAAGSPASSCRSTRARRRPGRSRSLS